MSISDKNENLLIKAEAGKDLTREDLVALADYLAEAHGGRPPAPRNIDAMELRGYVAAMHDAGYAKTIGAASRTSPRGSDEADCDEGYVLRDLLALRQQRRP